MNLYQQQLIDHYRNPRNKGSLSCPSFSSALHNPACGDSVIMQGTVENGAITAIAFDGTGCVISQGAASMLCQAVMGKAVDELRLYDAAYMLRLIGMELGPVRIKCALLPLEALQEGLKTLL